MSIYDEYIKILNLGKEFKSKNQSEQEKELKKAYRKLAKKYHPDMCSKEQKDWANQKMAELNNAYEKLKEAINENQFKQDSDNNDKENEYTYKEQEDNVSSSNEEKARYSSHGNSYAEKFYSNQSDSSAFGFYLKIFIIIIVISILAIILFPKANNNNASSSYTYSINDNLGDENYDNNENETKPKIKEATNYDTNEESTIEQKNTLNHIENAKVEKQETIIQKEPNWHAYASEISYRVKQRWDVDSNSVENDQVTIRFTMRRSDNQRGYVSDIKVISSSGSYYVDHEAIVAINGISGRYPMPEEFNGESVDIELKFPIMECTIIDKN